jgi:hypothetical protein
MRTVHNICLSWDGNETGNILIHQNIFLIHTHTWKTSNGNHTKKS